MLRQDQQKVQAQINQQDEINQLQIQNDNYYYSNYINSLKSKNTKNDYRLRLKYFMNFLDIKEGKCSKLVEDKDQRTIEDNIKSFLVYLRQDRGISYQSASHYLDAIRKFYYVNTEYDFRWKMIKMYLGDDDDTEHQDLEVAEEDRPYNREEIHTMLKSANDIRVRIMILLISSSGMRMGAIPLLKIRNLTKIDKLGFYQISVYEGSKKSNYKTFCTPECTNMIDSYLNYRKHAGEELKGSSPLIREQFNPKDKFKVNNPRHIGTGLIKYLINEVVVKYSALKQKLEYDYEKKRKIGKNPTMLTHALRKYFDTECRKAGVYPDFVELLMGHKLSGVRSHYFKPDMQTLLEGTAECKGYVTAINELTINEENRLSKQVQELKEKDYYNSYVIDKKLKSLEEAITKIASKVGTINSNNIKRKNLPKSWIVDESPEGIEKSPLTKSSKLTEENHDLRHEIEKDIEELKQQMDSEKHANKSK